MKTPFLRWMLTAMTATSLCLGVAHAQVDTSKSTVTATSKQMNVPVDGTFKKFTAQLNFDPANPAAGSARLSIDTASYDLGDESYNEQVRGKDWFGAAQYPNATFVSSSRSAAR
jgi:polyisoprenoid-binding protein YceI